MIKMKYKDKLVLKMNDAGDIEYQDDTHFDRLLKAGVKGNEQLEKKEKDLLKEAIQPLNESVTVVSDEYKQSSIYQTNEGINMKIKSKTDSSIEMTEGTIKAEAETITLN